MIKYKLFFGIVLSIISFSLSSVSFAAHHEKSFTERWKAGEDMKSVHVPSNANREEVHEIISEQEPDILYLDLHHSPGTEWDIKIQKHPGFESIGDCRAFVLKSLEGTGVKFGF